MIVEMQNCFLMLFPVPWSRSDSSSCCLYCPVSLFSCWTLCTCTKLRLLWPSWLHLFPLQSANCLSLFLSLRDGNAPLFQKCEKDVRSCLKPQEQCSHYSTTTTITLTVPTTTSTTRPHYTKISLHPSQLSLTCSRSSIKQWLQGWVLTLANN